MRKWFQKWRRQEPLIVEVSTPRRLAEPDEAEREAIISLQAHPGFQFLLQKLAFQRHLLESVLLTQRQENLKDVEFLQSGINWLRWLQGQIEAEIKFKKRRVLQPPSVSEKAALEQVMDQFEVVGRD